MRYPDNVEDLLGLGVGDPRWDGMTALHGSILCNQNSILEYLISQGADLNSRTDYGWTPLMITRRASSWRIQEGIPGCGSHHRKGAGAEAEQTR